MAEQLAPEEVAKALLAQGKEIVRQAEALRAFDEKGEGEPQAREMGKAIAAYDELVERFGDASFPAAREVIAEALMSKAACLLTIKHYAETVAVFDELLVRFGDATELSLREQVAKALCAKGGCLYALKRAEESIAADDELVTRFGGATELPLRELVAKALFNKACSLFI